MCDTSTAQMVMYSIDCFKLHCQHFELSLTWELHKNQPQMFPYHFTNSLIIMEIVLSATSYTYPTLHKFWISCCESLQWHCNLTFHHNTLSFVMSLFAMTSLPHHGPCLLRIKLGRPINYKIAYLASTCAAFGWFSRALSNSWSMG